MNCFLVFIGGLCILAGFGGPWLERLNLFRLPRDTVIDRIGFKFFFPITAMLIVSVLVSIVAWFMRGYPP